MKRTLGRLGLFVLSLWLFLCLCAPAVMFLSPEDTPAPILTPSPAPTAASTPLRLPAAKDSFRILDRSSGTVLTVSEADFLPLALLCEMSPEAPAEALKAQATAIRTRYRYARENPEHRDYDFTCDTTRQDVYAPAETFSSLFGEDWPGILEQIENLCRETAGLTLRYDGALISAPYFALSAGCTQPDAEDVPWLTAVACPGDLLYDGCKKTVRLTPEQIQTAFPETEFSENPANWFSAPVLFPTGYVETVSLCGQVFSGMEIQDRLSLRSPAFSVSWNGEAFLCTTLGWGHGVGMSQGAAMDMAAAGADFETILARFYPGTNLQAD